MEEPILTARDKEIWARWRQECLAWTHTAAHKRKVAYARHEIDRMRVLCPDAYVGWSAGKDSTAMAVLCAEVGVRGRYMSVKDDLDFPGEIEYLHEVARRIGVEDRLDILEPPISLQQWIRDHDVRSGEDLHSRHHDFSRQCFYDVISTYREASGTPGVYLGLRMDESHGRRMNYKRRGSIYRKLDDETVCQPIVTWSQRDVYGYLFARDIDLLDVYRCVRFAKTPGDIRKSWWVPGSSIDHGSAAWLRHYYPSLYERLRDLFPDAQEWT